MLTCIYCRDLEDSLTYYELHVAPYECMTMVGAFGIDNSRDHGNPWWSLDTDIGTGTLSCPWLVRIPCASRGPLVF
jgi:hypothetical protein